MRIILKACSLMFFALGVAILAKYAGFNAWVEQHTWIALPMILFGSIGINAFYGGGFNE